MHHLQKRIAKILRVEDEQPVLLVGAGNLGAALVGYAGLRQHNFNIVAVFDNNYNKIGRRLWDLEILDVERLKDVNETQQAEIAILTVPAEAAQGVADKLIEAGIKVILNFAPTSLRVPKGVFARHVCFIQELTVLSYHISPETDEGAV